MMTDDLSTDDIRCISIIWHQAAFFVFFFFFITVCGNFLIFLYKSLENYTQPLGSF